MAKKTYKTSPKGFAKYAWLTRPDTKFDANGKYKVNLIVKEADAQELIAECDEVAKKLFDEIKGKEKNPVKKKKLKLSSDTPYMDNEDGTITFKFSMKAKVEPKNGGESFTQKPILFDGQGHVITKDIALGDGSIIRVGYEAVGYNHAKDGVGTTLRLKAVQIIKFVPYVSGADASQFGFEAEEGAFSMDDEDFEPTSDDSEESDDDAETDDSDASESEEGDDDDADY